MSACLDFNNICLEIVCGIVSIMTNEVEKNDMSVVVKRQTTHLHINMLYMNIKDILQVLIYKALYG